MPIPSLEAYQFTLLSVVVAAATYIGTVARGVATKLGTALKENKPETERKPLVNYLMSLILADILLIALALLLGYRIINWIYGNPISLEYDRTICGVIFFAIMYLAILHVTQWFEWLSRIARKPPKDAQPSTKI